jgi:hypothetical protein
MKNGSEFSRQVGMQEAFSAEQTINTGCHMYELLIMETPHMYNSVLFNSKKWKHKENEIGCVERD